jgi:hypothetical protein
MEKQMFLKRTPPANEELQPKYKYRRMVTMLPARLKMRSGVNRINIRHDKFNIYLFREWAERHGIQSEKPENLISDKAAKLYRVGGAIACTRRYRYTGGRTLFGMF